MNFLRIINRRNFEIRNTIGRVDLVKSWWIPSSMTRPPTRLVTLMQMLSESHSELFSTTVVSFPAPSVKATSPGDRTYTIRTFSHSFHTVPVPTYST